jgi:ribosome-associated protein
MKIKVRVAEKQEIHKKINTEFVKLDAFLKLNDAVQTGGHAKLVIQGGEVKVNGETCLLRGKKIRKGDRVEFERKIYIAE